MMCKMQLKCQNLILHKHSTVTEENRGIGAERGEPEQPLQSLIPDLNLLPPECDQQSYNSDDPVDVLEKHNSDDLTVSAVNASSSNEFSYPAEKLLPFNKRKSKYYVCQEEKESSVSTIQETGCPAVEVKKEKYKSLQTIYRMSKPISDVKTDG